MFLKVSVTSHPDGRIISDESLEKIANHIISETQTITGFPLRTRIYFENGSSSPLSRGMIIWFENLMDVEFGSIVSILAQKLGTSAPSQDRHAISSIELSRAQAR